PLARRPDCEDLPHFPQPAGRGLAPSARGKASGGELSHPHGAAGHPRPGRDRRQCAVALRQATGGRAHRCARRHRQLKQRPAALARARRGCEREAPMMRLLNICVIAALVAAAAYVYKIKFESTLQAERLAKLRMELRREHDAIAALRAEWSKLD